MCSIVQLRRQFNLAMNRANAPEAPHASSHSTKHSLASPYQQRQDDDSSSYDSLNHISVEDHINFVSQTSPHETSLPNARAAARRSPHHAAHSDDDDEAADSRHYRDLLSSITSNMRENKLGGGGIEPFEIDHTSEVRVPVPSAASFNPYPAPVSRSHTRVGGGASAAAQLQKSSKASAAAVAEAASAAHHAYARPFSGSSGADSLRPFDIAAVEERMKLMRQSYLDQVRAIAGAQTKAFTVTAPDSMSARRMSRLATPGGQLRSMKGPSFAALTPRAFAPCLHLRRSHSCFYDTSTARHATHAILRFLHRSQAGHRERQCGERSGAAAGCLHSEILSFQTFLCPRLLLPSSSSHIQWRHCCRALPGLPLHSRCTCFVSFFIVC